MLPHKKNDWFNTPQGERFAYALALQIEHLHGDLGGRELLQIGGCGAHPWLSSLAYPDQWIVDRKPLPGALMVMASPHALPFAKHSMDCIVAPLCMELGDPQRITRCSAEKNRHADHAILDEMDRVLRPMGHLIFAGINPLSLWGMALKLGWLPGLNRQTTHLMSSYHLKRMLIERGYVVRGFVNFHYLWPVNQPYWIHKLEFLNEMGKMLTPFPAGFYCLIVQKYELGAVRPWLSAAREPWTVCEASMPMSQTTYKATTHD